MFWVELKIQFSKHLLCIFNQDLSYNKSFVGVSKTTNPNTR